MNFLIQIKKKYLFLVKIALLIFFLNSCDNSNKSIVDSTKMFLQKKRKETGVDFNNKIEETEELNYFTYQYIYMGGGVSVGDFNNDNLVDIYFTGNIVDNELYINQGEFKFKKTTKKSNTQLSNIWSTGSTVVDINNDGLLDIYVSIAGKEGSFSNKLLVNKGSDTDGIPKFIEAAKKYGIADNGRTEQSVFFDYDNDGDLDLYVVNYPITHFKTPVSFYAAAINNAVSESSSHFYKNNGDFTFTDVTKESGLLSFGLSIGVSVSDLNNDGFKDIYVSNDFASPDFIYFNNGDGTFTDQSKEVTQQTSFYGMGTDIADFNNDGLFDIVQLDMAPSSHKRSKENMASMDAAKFEEIIGLGLHNQYMYNTLQLNQGITNDGLPVFSNIAAFSGVKSTDWSWAGLFADFDNDGYKDLFVSNGTRRDIHNNDFFNQFKKNLYFKKTEERKKGDFEILKKMPSERLANYLFHNNTDLTFTNKSEDWGLSKKTFSNGAAYADFDNDGDLDLVINNIDEEASLYENTIDKKENANYLKIHFKGTRQNQLGIGNIVTIYKEGALQISELMLTRGYQSSVAPNINFGLKNYTTIDSLIVKWTDGSIQKLTDIKTNQKLILDYKDAIKNPLRIPQVIEEKLFTDITSKVNINHSHEENIFFDYKIEPLLPHKMSQFGPGLAVGDVNGDELDDFWIGGAFNRSGALYIQNKEGNFSKSNVNVFESDLKHEDLDGVFFDADNDGDLDLYVVSGGNEFTQKSAFYQDRFYINDGKGNFKRNKNAIPEFNESGSKAISIDFDNDGDLDLFVASRLIPHKYPTPATSYLLENRSTKTNVKFKKETKNISAFEDLGMVTDAISIDFDNDNDLDLIVVGEWMPITFLENNNNVFENVTNNNFIKNSSGWWYSIKKTDLDKDGDQDFVVGNLGLNYKYKSKPKKTFDVFANDFDNNGRLDIVLSYYEGKRQLPLRGRECSSQQIPGIANKFKNYEDYSNANLVDIYTEDKLEDGLHLKAENFASLYVENLGNGTFNSIELPSEAQFSSINAILVDDYNKDGNDDILLAGNLFASEAETPRNDASIGLLLENTNNKLKPVSLYVSGFLTKNDVRNMRKIIIKEKKCILVANNNNMLQVFKVKE